MRSCGRLTERVQRIEVAMALAVADIEPQLRTSVAAAVASALGGGDIAFLDLAANQSALSEKLRAAVEPAFAQWVSCTSFYIESLLLAEEVQSISTRRARCAWWAISTGSPLPKRGSTENCSGPVGQRSRHGCGHGDRIEQSGCDG